MLQIIVPFVLLILLLIMGMPIGFTLGFVGIIGYSLTADLSKALAVMSYHSYNAFYNFAFSPIPLFILMGEIVHVSGIGSGLYETVSKWFGQIRGGLSAGSVMACSVFAAATGLSIAGVATVGTFAVPEMIKRGYNQRLASGSVTAAGTLGILIPPSLPLIVYGITAEASIGRLFMAGIFPGIVLTSLFITYIFIRAWLNPSLAPGVPGVSWREKVVSLQQLWPIVVLIAAVLGGIYLGVITPSEAGAVGAFGALCIGIIYRKVNIQSLWKACWRTAATSGFIFMLILGATYFSHYLTITGMTQDLSLWLGSLQISKWGILGGIFILFLFLGTFLDAVPIILLTTPLLLPVVVALGFNPIWYGIFLVMNLEIAFVTPPMGMNLYTMKRICPEVPLREILFGSIPFLILTVVAMGLITAFPEVALWLPTTMMD
ncbi:TRAP transporter large permease [Chloroflexota bacterium]